MRQVLSGDPLASRILILLSILLFPTTTLAYPSSVLFSPSGDAKDLGTVSFLAYGVINVAPKVAPGSSWFGIQGGLLPQWKYGGSGLSFGGLEGGLDIITPLRAAQGGTQIKPVLNLKLGTITEGAYTPSVSVGLMELSPHFASMDFAYVVATKTLRKSPEATSGGRITVGYGFSAGNRTQFNGSWPLRDTRSALLAAYETPLIAGRLGLMLDYLGGTSEISDTYLGAVLNLTGAAAVGAGGFLANDRANSPNDGVFFYLTETLEVTKL